MKNTEELLKEVREILQRCDNEIADDFNAYKKGVITDTELAERTLSHKNSRDGALAQAVIVWEMVQ